MVVVFDDGTVVSCKPSSIASDALPWLVAIDPCTRNLFTQPDIQLRMLRPTDQIDLVEHDKVGALQLVQHRASDILVRGPLANGFSVSQHHHAIQPDMRGWLPK